MLREIREEIKLDLGSTEHEQHYHALRVESVPSSSVASGRQTMTNGLSWRIRVFVVNDQNPKIEWLVIIRGMHCLPEGMMSHMRLLVE